ncbi:MAG: hypothetical protein ACYDB7_00775 [Mycobacteriales bacterium]
MAEEACAALATSAGQLIADFKAPDPAGSGLGQLVAMVAAVAAVVSRRFGPCSAWQLAAAMTGGRLLAPTGPPTPVAANTSVLWAMSM